MSDLTVKNFLFYKTNQNQEIDSFSSGILPSSTLKCIQEFSYLQKNHNILLTRDNFFRLGNFINKLFEIF
ncbi:hypothetical protein bcgnr5376_57360 [Bacillus cereus]